MMRKISLMAAAVVALTLGAGSANAQALGVGTAGAKKVTLSDKVGKNQFTWVSEAPLENIKGTSEGVSGSFTIDPKNLASLRGTITTQVTTMKTGNGTRDEHLKGNQWLDGGKYPTISFTITSVSNVKASGNAATGTATGNFTMHGVTKTISIPFKLQYIPESAKTKERAPGDLVMVTADFTVSLKDFNVAGSKGIVGSKVGETIKVSAQLYGATGL